MFLFMEMMKLVKNGFYITLCFSMCVYWTCKQYGKFSDDDDSSAIYFKEFNLEPEDLYPEFSICFFGNIISTEKIKRALNATTGHKGVRQLYVKMLTGQQNLTEEMRNINFSDVTISLGDFLQKFATRRYDRKPIYKFPKVNSSIASIPMFVKYHTPQHICYTLKVKFVPGLVLHSERLAFNATKITESFSKVIIVPHAKGKFFSNLIQSQGVVVHPRLELRPLKSKNGSNYVITIKVTEEQILDKRSHANHTCDTSLVDEDSKLIAVKVRKIGCVPTYFKDFVQSSAMNDSEANIPECWSTEQHRNFLNGFPFRLLKFAHEFTG